MSLLELFKKNRSYRRFYEGVSIEKGLVCEWIKNLRYTSSMRNAQPLKYKVIDDPKTLEALYPHLHWAGYLKEWDGPKKGERPPLLVLQLLDKSLSSTSRYDEGLQLSSFTLQATEAGLGCCILLAFDVPAFIELLSIDENLKPLAVVAVGKPKETIVIEDLNGENIAYYRTPDGVHHVPKRIGDELIVS